MILRGFIYFVSLVCAICAAGCAFFGVEMIGLGDLFGAGMDFVLAVLICLMSVANIYLARSLRP